MLDILRTLYPYTTQRNTLNRYLQHQKNLAYASEVKNLDAKTRYQLLELAELGKQFLVSTDYLNKKGRAGSSHEIAHFIQAVHNYLSKQDDKSLNLLDFNYQLFNQRYAEKNTSRKVGAGFQMLWGSTEILFGLAFLGLAVALTAGFLSIAAGPVATAFCVIVYLLVGSAFTAAGIDNIKESIRELSNSPKKIVDGFIQHIAPELVCKQADANDANDESVAKAYSTP